MKIEQVEVAKLIPYANNAKLHDDAQVASIAGSIREFGFNNPVLIDKDGGIIAGHGRVLAARKLELDKVPCIRLGHLTENQKRAYIIADNRLAEMGGGWDRDMLKIELEDIDFGEFDNFTMDDLGDLGINFDDDGGGEGEAPDSSSGEVDVDSFNMECRCPKCGFEFDPKNKG